MKGVMRRNVKHAKEMEGNQEGSRAAGWFEQDNMHDAHLHEQSSISIKVNDVELC